MEPELMTEVWDILAVTIAAHIENKFNYKVAFVVKQLLFNLGYVCPYVPSSQVND